MRTRKQPRGDPQLTSARPDAISYREFLEWADEDTLAEWVDGEIVAASPASLRHQQILQFLLAVLELYVKIRGLGRVIPAPFQMKLPAVARLDPLARGHQAIGADGACGGRAAHKGRTAGGPAAREG